MTAEMNTERPCFRFRTATGQWLTDEIIALERLATERIKAGASVPSAQTGCRMLLKELLHDRAIDCVELAPESVQFPACPPPLEPPRWGAREGRS